MSRPNAVKLQKQVKKVLQRNNTSFPVLVTAKLKQLYETFQNLKRGPPSSEESKWAAFLKYYQFMAREVMSNPEYGIGTEGNARGLLIYHPMGMGKTILAISISEALKDKRTPVIVLPHSLKSNISDSLYKVIALLNADASQEKLSALQKEAISSYKFISFDAYNMADQVIRIETKKNMPALKVETEGSLDNKLLIVDEAHDFFKAIINSATDNTNARRLYNMIQNAQNLRIVFLTGTPISKDPFEMVPCFNMLAGIDLLPVQYDTFYRLYVDESRTRLKNIEKLANRLLGMVSHVSPDLPTEPDDKKIVKKLRSLGGYPEQFPLKIEKVEMAPEQYKAYSLAREKEEAEGKGTDAPRAETVMSAPPLSLPGSKRRGVKSYNVKSRSMSNFTPPRELYDTPIASMPDTAFSNVTSPKAAVLVKNIVASRGINLVYSQFVEVGLSVIERFLINAGYEKLDPSGVRDNPEQFIKNLAPKKRFATISGRVPVESRKDILTVSNSSKNIHGDILQVVLVTKTGVTGLDFKNIRNTHVFEPYWDKSREVQFRGRSARMGSHDALEEKERDVHHFLYISTANAKIWENRPVKGREDHTIDELFHERATQRYSLCLAALCIVKSVSLECNLLNYGNCRECVPTDAPLFHSNYDQDLRLPDPCIPLKTSEVKAKKILLDGKQYFYNIKPGTDEYQFYSFNKELDGYELLESTDSVALKLLEIASGKY